uniref:Uncharacterized protein n=1 Tax=Sphaerodactylus townsendi TaxID=933632 RepID=A0ACB8FBN2_9SAUR
MPQWMRFLLGTNHFPLKRAIVHVEMIDGGLGVPDPALQFTIRFIVSNLIRHMGGGIKWSLFHKTCDGNVWMTKWGRGSKDKLPCRIQGALQGLLDHIKDLTAHVTHYRLKAEKLRTAIETVDLPSASMVVDLATPSVLAPVDLAPAATVVDLASSNFPSQLADVPGMSADNRADANAPEVDLASSHRGQVSLTLSRLSAQGMVGCAEAAGALVSLGGVAPVIALPAHGNAPTRFLGPGHTRGPGKSSSPGRPPPVGSVDAPGAGHHLLSLAPYQMTPLSQQGSYRQHLEVPPLVTSTTVIGSSLPAPPMQGKAEQGGQVAGSREGPIEASVDQTNCAKMDKSTELSSAVAPTTIGQNTIRTTAASPTTGAVRVKPGFAHPKTPAGLVSGTTAISNVDGTYNLGNEEDFPGLPNSSSDGATTSSGELLNSSAVTASSITGRQSSAPLVEASVGQRASERLRSLGADPLETFLQGQRAVFAAHSETGKLPPRVPRELVCGEQGSSPQHDDPAAGPAPAPSTTGTTGTITVPRSYARVAQTGTAGGARHGSSVRSYQPSKDAVGDEEMLMAYYDALRATAAEQAEAERHYVIRVRYRGKQPEFFLSRDYFVGEFLIQHMGVSSAELKAVSIPPGMLEADIIFNAEAAYHKFWERCRQAQSQSDPIFKDFELQPLFRGETRVVTVYLRSGNIPKEDISRRLAREGRVLLEPCEKRDEFGVWTCEFRLVMGLDRTPEGRLRHLPRYFFMGGERATVRYSGQPPACYICGDYGHLRRDCTSRMCSRCGGKGHNTEFCSLPVCCSLCGKEGHPYRWCPESKRNASDPDRYAAEWEAESARRIRREEEFRRQKEESRRQKAERGRCRENRLLDKASERDTGQQREREQSSRQEALNGAAAVRPAEDQSGPGSRQPGVSRRESRPHGELQPLPAELEGPPWQTVHRKRTLVEMGARPKVSTLTNRYAILRQDADSSSEEEQMELLAAGKEADTVVVGTELIQGAKPEQQKGPTVGTPKPQPQRDPRNRKRKQMVQSPESHRRRVDQPKERRQRANEDGPLTDLSLSCLFNPTQAQEALQDPSEDPVHPERRVNSSADVSNQPVAASSQIAPGSSVVPPRKNSAEVVEPQCLLPQQALPTTPIPVERMAVSATDTSLSAGMPPPSTDQLTDPGGMGNPPGVVPVESSTPHLPNIETAAPLPISTGGADPDDPLSRESGEAPVTLSHQASGADTTGTTNAVQSGLESTDR